MADARVDKPSNIPTKAVRRQKLYTIRQRNNDYVNGLSVEEKFSLVTGYPTKTDFEISTFARYSWLEASQFSLRLSFQYRSDNDESAGTGFPLSEGNW